MTMPTKPFEMALQEAALSLGILALAEAFRLLS